nr:MAG TPA: hypothetical protein [Caudoviricetes sp.]
MSDGTLSEYVQLKEIAEADGIGGDSWQFHEDAARPFLAYMNEMETWCQNISKTVESRIRKVIGE